MYSPAVLQNAPDVMAPMFVVATSWLAFGRLAVAVFIVISGYCLMLPVVRSEHRRLSWTWTRFMGRRARRILPPYYGALAVSIALIVFVPGLDDPDIGEWHKSFPALTTGSVLSHLAVIHNYFPDWQYSIDHPMWSIATEWQIYFLFPGLVWVWSRFGLRKLIITSLAICVVLQLFVALLLAGHDPWPPQFVALFGLGMAGAAYNHPRSNEDRQPRRQAAWGRRALWLFTLGGISMLLVGNIRPQVPDFLVGAATVCAMIALTQAAQRGQQPWALRVLERAPLVSLGHFSYSLYLLHAPSLALFFVIAREIGLGMTSIQFFILGVGLPVTVMASYVFYLVFERPFISARSSPGLDRNVVLPGATTYVSSGPLPTQGRA
jgi:peptidoglycan/LPS O-acetylase OafA/YrhL